MAISTGANLPEVTEQSLAAAQERYIKKTGRPSKFTEEVAISILNRLAEGETLRSICRDETMPCNVTVYDWKNNIPAFASAIAYARKIQATSLAEEALQVTDDAETETMAHVRKAEARANLRMQLAKCFDRETFGDKVQQDINVKGVMVTTSSDRLKKLLDGE